MPYNIDDIKRLTKAERLEIIQELLSGIDSEMSEETFLTDEDLILNERITAYESNTMKFYSWEEVKEKLENRLKRMKGDKD
jgi:putative addiction module component (TIGR02574 family)